MSETGEFPEPAASGGMPEEAMMEHDELLPALEALLFAAGDPLSLDELKMAVPEEDRPRVEDAMAALTATYEASPRGMQIVRVAGGYRMVTRPRFDRHLRALRRQRNRHRLGRAALETLAVIAYRQPITAPEIAEIRGKDPGGVLRTLLDKRLIRTQGRKRVVGRPFLYATTRDFLIHFGLDSLKDLPSMEEFSEMISEPELPLEVADRGADAAGSPPGNGTGPEAEGDVPLQDERPEE